MVSIFFNEKGFVIETPTGVALKNYDAPGNVMHNAMALYDFRWFVLNEALTMLYDGFIMSGQHLELYTDSRIVEELNGELTPDNDFAKKSRAYYIAYDLPRFRSIRIQKCPTSAIERKLHASQTS
jgi:hypothetical protein